MNWKSPSGRSTGTSPLSPTSGVPVYASRGPGGGVRLIEEYRTTLTGLTPDETRALFTMSIPAPLVQLGMDEKFKGALLKLSASLPDTRRADEARTRQRILLDSSWWFQSEQEVPCLQTIQQALWQDRRLRIKVRWEFFNTEFEQDAEPYGLVAKANIWYLVYGRGGTPHVTRVSQIVEAEIMPECFHRARLSFSWKRSGRNGAGSTSPSLRSVRGYGSRRRRCPCSRNMLAIGPAVSLHHQPDRRMLMAGSRLTCRSNRSSLARSRLLGLGRAVEVLEPEPLRRSLIDFAEQIVGFYKDK